jgi:hypothetical protein
VALLAALAVVAGALYLRRGSAAGLGAAPPPGPGAGPGAALPQPGKEQQALAAVLSGTPLAPVALVHKVLASPAGLKGLDAASRGANRVLGGLATSRWDPATLGGAASRISLVVKR